MSRKSLSSSMEAWNGSTASSYTQGAYCSDAAYSSSSTPSYTPHGRYPRRYSGSAVASQHVARSQLAYNNSYSSNGDTNEHIAVQNSSSYSEGSTQTPQYDHRSFVSQEHHYLSPSITESHETAYPPELMIEEEQQETTSSSGGVQSIYTSHSEEWSTTNQAYYTQSDTQGSDRPFSTTNSWSVQQLTEERLRLGLSRWESEEQQHAAYENVRRS